jgi:hypothetical protein
MLVIVDGRLRLTGRCCEKNRGAENEGSECHWGILQRMGLCGLPEVCRQCGHFDPAHETSGLLVIHQEQCRDEKFGVSSQDTRTASRLPMSRIVPVLPLPASSLIEPHC